MVGAPRLGQGQRSRRLRIVRGSVAGSRSRRRAWRRPARVRKRSPSPRLHALGRAPALDSQARVENEAALRAAADGVEVSLNDLGDLPEQQRELLGRSRSCRYGLPPGNELERLVAGAVVRSNLDASRRSVISRTSTPVGASRRWVRRSRRHVSYTSFAHRWRSGSQRVPQRAPEPAQLEQCSAGLASGPAPALPPSRPHRRDALRWCCPATISASSWLASVTAVGQPESRGPPTAAWPLSARTSRNGFRDARSESPGLCVGPPGPARSL